MAVELDLVANELPSGAGPTIGWVMDPDQPHVRS